MRTKTLLLSAAVGAASLVAANAQAVYSQNAVGYINLTLPAGFSMMANQLDNGNGNLIGDVLSVPDGTTVYKYDPGAGVYEANNYFFGWGDENMTLNPGEGVFINNASGAPLTVTLVGEVPQGDDSNIDIPAGISIVASTVPIEAGLDSDDMLFPAADGDTVYMYDNAAGVYETYNYFFGWGGNVPTPAVGESFFVSKVAAVAWDRDFDVNAN